MILAADVDIIKFCKLADDLKHELGCSVDSQIRKNYEQNIHYCLVLIPLSRGNRYCMRLTQETYDACKQAWFKFEF